MLGRCTCIPTDHAKRVDSPSIVSVVKAMRLTETTCYFDIARTSSKNRMKTEINFFALNPHEVIWQVATFTFCHLQGTYAISNINFHT